MTTLTSTSQDTARLRELSDRAELTDLVSRQGRWLDERLFDDSAAVFTDDATARTPGGQVEGIEALTAQARRNHIRFARTQHVTSNILIDLDGDRATVGANLTVHFVQDEGTAEPVFSMGERYRFEAVRTPAGWRFSRVEVTPVWKSGSLPQQTAS